MRLDVGINTLYNLACAYIKRAFDGAIAAELLVRHFDAVQFKRHIQSLAEPFERLLISANEAALWSEPFLNLLGSKRLFTQSTTTFELPGSEVRMSLPWDSKDTPSPCRCRGTQPMDGAASAAIGILPSAPQSSIPPNAGERRPACERRWGLLSVLQCNVPLR